VIGDIPSIYLMSLSIWVDKNLQLLGKKGREADNHQRITRYYYMLWMEEILHHLGWLKPHK
jgi:hypothetical protein